MRFRYITTRFRQIIIRFSVDGSNRSPAKSTPSMWTESSSEISNLVFFAEENLRNSNRPKSPRLHSAERPMAFLSASEHARTQKRRKNKSKLTSAIQSQTYKSFLKAMCLRCMQPLPSTSLLSASSMFGLCTRAACL